MSNMLHVLHIYSVSSLSCPEAEAYLTVIFHSLGKKGPEGLEDVHHCGAVDGDREGDASDGEPEGEEKIQFVPGAGVYDELH